MPPEWRAEKKGIDKAGVCHTVYGMKMTMHIDEALLERVMKAYEFQSTTEAVEMSLREMDRRVRLKEYRKKGLGFSAEELADSVDPDYDLSALRVAEAPRKRGYGKNDPR
jgi:Arc/MetJ family transcription regulator